MYSPILTNLKSLSNQDQWNTVEDILEQIARETQQELLRKKSRQQVLSTNNSTNQAKRNVRITDTRCPTSQITNLSNHQLSRDEIALLSKGLNFIPTQRRDHPAKMLQDILLFDRRIRLKYNFYNASDQNHGTSEQTIKYYTPAQGGPLQVDRIHS